jgi:glycine/D-amino acid oxidase-like deaminating enzyme
MLDAIIIGGGLFGQIIAAALRSQGATPLVIDNQMPDAGSKPAACLMKPSWFSSLGKSVYEPALKLLSGLYTVETVEFRTRPLGLETAAYWINPAHILVPGALNETVVNIYPGGVLTLEGNTYETHNVIVAAGIWTSRLLTDYQQLPQKGAAFLWPGEKRENFISVWAPYRQLVGFDRRDGYWVGDGTAIRAANWTQERQNVSQDRCSKAADLPAPPITMTGIRPYAPGHKPCLLEEIEPGLWVASGGAKNGTLAAGWAANEIMWRLR